ncbi:hypothetical protein, conserved [Eimeria tenella]|uniref:Uncharacterized protein n=1 Tax=Eimeria tenella TaxID=5802 RepID=U6KKR7_EIMTE|nr:hypothetical protein, conserved [Eimeria tenella]CDJ38519.1 hypothetical protein, conserved [Eimeria tenella]|eukprot:XP_013229357.1 hypothetical protein, conserved [Eimeria tenella]
MWKFHKTFWPDTLADARLTAALPAFREKIVFVGDAQSGKTSVIDSVRAALHQQQLQQQQPQQQRPR